MALLSPTISEIPPAPSFLMERPDAATILREREERVALEAKIAHLHTLHGTRNRGNATVIVDSAFDAGVQLRTRELAKSPAAHTASHVSLQRHYEGRGALAQVNALMWADCEISPSSPFHGMPAHEIAGILLARMDAAGIPRPSYILYSGRGLWCVWLSRHPLTARVQTRIRRLLRCLWGEAVATKKDTFERVKAKAAANASVWAGMDLDWSVGDMARVHRVAGSLNEKSGERVRLLWPESWADVQRHDLETLADAVFPFDREEMRTYREAQAAKKAAREEQAKADGQPVTPRRPRSHSRGLWGAVEGELISVLGLGPERLARMGLRDRLCFHIAVARARSGMGGDADSWAAEFAPHVVGKGLSQDNLRSYLRPVDKRLRADEAGEVRMHEGRAVSPLYTPKLAKVRTDLSLPADVCDELGLTLLRPDAPTRTATERSAARRQREGATARADHAQTLAEVARLTREIQAATDLPVAEIARLLGCSRATVYRALDAHPAVEITATEQDQTISRGVSETARYLKGGVASPAAPVLPQVEMPVPAWVEADPNPDLVQFYRWEAEHRPLPDGQVHADHGDRLQRLFWHFLRARGHVNSWMRQHVRREAIESAIMTLQGEIEDGKLMVGLPTEEPIFTAPKPRPRDWHRCGRAAPTLH
ncbi:helix-turn-helix domain-containing protein [Methylobacterium sp. SD21]|uniref:helix-turn-helix domain-containing protein n=1 Tax=Methylobacterium litchii TaxID=3138810 RepID=UPI00313B3632